MELILILLKIVLHIGNGAVIFYTDATMFTSLDLEIILEAMGNYEILFWSPKENECLYRRLKKIKKKKKKYIM